MILVRPDGRRLEIKESGSALAGKRLGQALQNVDDEFSKGLIGGRIGDAYIDLAYVLNGTEDEIHVFELSDDEHARWLYRHSMSHVLAQAVKRLYPDAKLAIGPAIEEGFYYDFDVETPFSHDDLEKISDEM